MRPRLVTAKSSPLLGQWANPEGAQGDISVPGGAAGIMRRVSAEGRGAATPRPFAFPPAGRQGKGARWDMAGGKRDGLSVGRR